MADQPGPTDSAVEVPTGGVAPAGPEQPPPRGVPLPALVQRATGEPLTPRAAAINNAAAINEMRTIFVTMDQGLQDLRARMDALSANPQAAATTSLGQPPAVNVRTVPVKMNRPKPYHGDPFHDRGRTTRSWLDALETYYNACGLTTPDRVAMASTMLEGNAQLWWSEQRRVGREALLLASWEQFKVELIEEFEPVDASKIAKQQLMQIEQQTSVQAYIAKFRQYTQQAGLHDSILLEMFLRGLKKAVRIYTELANPTTVLEAAMAAQRADRILYQRSQEKVNGKRVKPMELGNLEAVYPGEIYAMNHRSGHGRSTPSGAGNKVICYYCKKPGHVKAECRRFQQRMGHPTKASTN